MGYALARSIFCSFTLFHNMVATIKKNNCVGSQNSPSFEVDGRAFKVLYLQCYV